MQDFQYITKNKHILVQDDQNGAVDYNCAQHCLMVDRIQRDRSSINSIDGQEDEQKNESDQDAIYRNICCHQ